ncbi:hypothetical protein CHLNCDRAFT_29783 [Chlorella variabilis]|uniref:CobW C-terminal domain-containing protein n=1 Tax=Chlorella variabilis TaxID=554065 RepID=E1Z5L3_CHLVA|nr:hypothetical protein CHLNCDRAFT_29783 [Chlorella variabilis]EFN58776.1 hypothetical protein CHLNCDRAFT_29783 [Chlorella variabilis]|eukprot:XP_005850878.1 hypothetical protein CHLNCDRAFT_29783 [Chlorella variabilis]
MSSDDEDVPLAVPLQASGAGKPAQAPAPGAAAPAAPPTPVPVTLITGYLGAGKTTLVNHVLTAKHGYRCAVLLNEIADSADIERALVKEPEGRDASPLAEWAELENGCICCSAKNDMVRALEALMQQRSRFDYVLIETTGLANPGPVAAALWTDEQLESSVCLDCIVTVVDGRHVERQLGAPRPAGAINEAQQQVAFADVVLLNKVDLAGEEQLARVEGTIRGMNAEAAILRCQRCEIDLARILNTGIYSAVMQGLQAAGAEPGSGHDSRVGTVTILLPGRPLDLPRLRHWLDALLWEQEQEQEQGQGQGQGSEGAAAGAAGGAAGAATAAAAAPVIFRIKGLLHVEGSERKHILQGVHEIYDVVEGPAWAPGEDRRSKVVLIGRGLDRRALERGLHSCLAPL